VKTSTEHAVKLDVD